MVIKKNDFVELEYTGKTKDENFVFDTTKEQVAKDNNLFNEKIKYGPVIICIGQGFLLKGLENKLEGKELGKYIIDLAPENAFGRKDSKLVQIIPFKKFIEQKINPVPGLQINIDGVVGLVKTAGGGRVIVDFNHPLSSKDVVYDVELKKVVTDPEEKVKAFLRPVLGDVKVKLDNNTAVISFNHELPEEVKKEFSSKIKEVVGIDAIFITESEKKIDKKV